MKDNIINPFWSFISIIGVVIFALIGLIFQDVLKEIILVVCVVVFVYFLRRTIKLRKEIKEKEQQQAIENLLTDLSQNISQLICINVGEEFYKISVEILELFFEGFFCCKVFGRNEIINLANNNFKVSLTTHILLPLEKRKEHETIMISLLTALKKRLLDIVRINIKENYQRKTEFENNFFDLIKALKKINLEKIILEKEDTFSFSLNDVCQNSLILLKTKKENFIHEELPFSEENLFLVLSITSFLPECLLVNDPQAKSSWKKFRLLSLHTGQVLTWQYCKKEIPELLNLGNLVSYNNLTIKDNIGTMKVISEDNLPQILNTRINIDYHSKGGQVFNCYFYDAVPMRKEETEFTFITYKYLSSPPYCLVIEYYSPLFKGEWRPIYFAEKIDIQNVKVLSV